jgi:hypothetical protein
MTLGRIATGAIALVAAAFAIGLSSDANASWEKVDPMQCRPANAMNKGGDACECGSYVNWYSAYNYSYEPELRLQTSTNTLTFYCPVPDDILVSVDQITAYTIAGYSPTGSASAARGCIQFTDGYSESCLSGMFPFPEGDFNNWNMPVPSNWTQYWHNAYVEVRLKGMSGGGIGASIRSIAASTP